MARRPFGIMPDGAPVEELTLTGGGLAAAVITYGGALRSLLVPDREGKPVDVLLGFDTLEDYRKQDKYIGALIGRYGNRIGGSRFTLGGREYRLTPNEAPNHLHGGQIGFDKRVWEVRECREDSLTLFLTSPDGDEGYPGTLQVSVTYALADGALAIDYRAVCDRATLCSLTSHAYWNLSGHGSGDIAGQQFRLPSGRYVPVDGSAIPTGGTAPVAGTPMDLRQLRPLGEREYDHNWVVEGWTGDHTLRPAAQAGSPVTRIAMEVLTTMPGVQFYTGNFLEGCPRGKGGAVYPRHGAFCLETQYYPDSPNRPEFPSALLEAGEEYQSRTVYRFRAGGGA